MDIGTAIPLQALNIAHEQWGAHWVAKEVEGLAKFLQAAHVNGRLAVEPLPLDGGKFAEWSAADLAAQCRAQARNMMDPELSRFLNAVAGRLPVPDSTHTGQVEAAVEAFLDRHQGWMTKAEWSAANQDLVAAFAARPQPRRRKGPGGP